MHYQGS